MLTDLAAVWICKDFGLKNHVGRASCPPRPRRPRMVALHLRSRLKPMAGILPASYPATTNGRPTIALNTQAHGGHLARLSTSGDHKWSPYNPVQHPIPCRAGILPASRPRRPRMVALHSPLSLKPVHSCPPRTRRPRMVALQ